MVSIIVVNYNGEKWLNIFFRSLQLQAYKQFEVIFIDNHSNDESVKLVKNNYQNVKIILNNKNVGFSQANNLGVKASRGETILFINTDTELPADLIGNLLYFKQVNKLNIVGPRVLNKDRIDALKGKFLGIDYLGFPGLSDRLFYIDGCALMISKKDYLNLGGFDDKYFMYSEDVDLCWRAHLYGMKIGVCQDTAVSHFGGGSSETTMYEKGKKHIVPIFRRYEVEKNNLRSILKNYKFFNLLWVIPLFIFQNTIESLFYLLIGNLTMFKTIWKAIGWNLLNIGSTLTQRKIIQKKRVVNDRQILSMMFFGLNKLSAFGLIGLPKFK